MVKRKVYLSNTPISDVNSQTNLAFNLFLIICNLDSQVSRENANVRAQQKRVNDLQLNVLLVDSKISG